MWSSIRGATDHHDLDGAIDLDRSKSFVFGEGKLDLQGHGTHVLGIIGAQNNATGVVGVAPKARVIALKALNKYGEGLTESLYEALDYAVDLKPDIINMSLGSYERQKELEPLYQTLVRTHNVCIVAAAGNFGKQGVMYPAKYPYVFSVGSYKESRDISAFSSFEDQLVDFAAPGEDILSTYLKGEYAVLSGTSMAAPFFSGILALIISKLKKDGISYTPESLKALLKDNSIDLGLPGHDKFFGYGIIDVPKTLAQIKSGVILPPPAPDPKPDAPEGADSLPKSGCALALFQRLMGAKIGSRRLKKGS